MPIPTIALAIWLVAIGFFMDKDVKNSVKGLARQDAKMQCLKPEMQGKRGEVTATSEHLSQKVTLEFKCVKGKAKQRRWK